MGLENITSAYAKQIFSIGTTAVNIPHIVEDSSGNKIRAQRVWVTVETQDVRWWAHGESPTAADGHLIYAGSFFTLDGPVNIENLQICATSGTARVTVTYGKI